MQVSSLCGLAETLKLLTFIGSSTYSTLKLVMNLLFGNTKSAFLGIAIPIFNLFADALGTSIPGFHTSSLSRLGAPSALQTASGPVLYQRPIPINFLISLF